MNNLCQWKCVIPLKAQEVLNINVFQEKSPETARNSINLDLRNFNQSIALAIVIQQSTYGPVNSYRFS